MGSNIYHILDFIPGIEKEEILVGQESLASQLVNTGRLRIDADYSKINFARFYVPSLGLSMMFSSRELNDQRLLPATRKMIGRQLTGQYRGEMLRKQVDDHIRLLRLELDKYQKLA